MAIMEGCSGEVGIEIRDKANVIVPPESVDTLTFTLRDALTGKIINGRTATDIKSYYAGAGSAFPLVAADNPVLDQNRKLGETEDHVGIVRGTLAGNQAVAKAIIIPVERVG